MVVADAPIENNSCRRWCCAQSNPLYGLVRRLPQSRGATTTFVARERLVVGGLAWPTAHNHMSLGPSGMLPGTTMNSTPWLVNRCISYSRLCLDRRSVTFCRLCVAPTGSYFGIGRAALERCVTLCLLPPVRAERRLRRRNDCAAYHHSLLAWRAGLVGSGASVDLQMP